ncbi:uncharacterized protein PHACADRAFT_262673 [Phanerochaete carnosa HHB-10118-sp]|uniref:AB hydrolase-1 domain-containing protein n=1 Tax=Phanerochaete carnosa (strain HHB-10118-sp) TaxID=650164 RepID=K5VZ97_PHACS|nr:uncharacterized protein PHACADRAFT_262673 [Phanerochaete carnosa HHB-10118-sp]EKM52165.1 hypothetical protein PHACADRAFT_262673 [Phanerochaete carnosa HHB-10118-sp]
MVTINKEAVSADGTRIYAEAAGDPSNPALVCMHGFTGTSFTFHKQLANPQLLRHVFVIAYDLRGNGRSDKPEDAAAYAGERVAEDFRAVCEAFGVVRPVALGWSLGAIVILDILNHLPPGYIRGAVYSGGPALTRPLHNTFMSTWLQTTLPPLLGSSDATVVARATVEFLDGCFGHPRTDMTYEQRMRWLGEIMFAPPPTRVVYEAVTRERDTTHFLERMRDVPLLVLQGTEDMHVDVHKLKATFDELFSGKKDYEFVWMEGIGHCVAWEKAEEHDELIVRFMKRLS